MASNALLNRIAAGGVQQPDSMNQFLNMQRAMANKEATEASRADRDLRQQALERTQTFNAAVPGLFSDNPEERQSASQILMRTDPEKYLLMKNQVAELDAKQLDQSMKLNERLAGVVAGLAASDDSLGQYAANKEQIESIVGPLPEFQDEQSLDNFLRSKAIELGAGSELLNSAWLSEDQKLNREKFAFDKHKFETPSADAKLSAETSRRGQDLRSQAGGMTITGPDGSIITIGGGAKTPLGKPATNQVEEKAVNAQFGMDRLRAIQSSFKPEFLTVAGRFENMKTKVKDLAGAELNPDEKRYIQEFNTFKSDTLSNLNLYIKEITGAAMSQPESQRIKAAMPNMDDGPAGFKAKLDNVTKQLAMANARAMYLRQNGLSMDQVPLGSMRNIIDSRGAQLEEQIRENNPGMDETQIREAVKSRLKQEFGI